MYLHIFIGSPKNKVPFCIETNIEYALKYWKKRKEANPDIQWILSSQPKISSYLLT